MMKNTLNDKNRIKISLEGVEYLYHATPSCYVDSIREYGLGGNLPEKRNENYVGTPYENITQGCFLATDEYVAESHVETSEAFERMDEEYRNQYNKELDIVVFRLKVKNLHFERLSFDENLLVDDDTDPTFFYDGIISYKDLDIVHL